MLQNCCLSHSSYACCEVEVSALVSYRFIKQFAQFFLSASVVSGQGLYSAQCVAAVIRPIPCAIAPLLTVRACDVYATVDRGLGQLGAGGRRRRR